ncbi:MAG: nuclear transport factor 2 family protein [Caldilineales bacterium]|nr:nuclear transport factor 2 family protein [Caldilineales bacterium]
MTQTINTVEIELLELLDRHLQSIWQGDAEAYKRTTAEDVSFFEWYISPQRIDGIDFHFREIRVHAAVLAGAVNDEATIEHEILQPRVQIYGDTAIVTYTLMLRSSRRGNAGGVSHKSHNETRVFHNFGDHATPDWRLVHCHKSPIATLDSLSVLR